jgi:hypothetical protein
VRKGIRDVIKEGEREMRKRETVKRKETKVQYRFVLRKEQHCIALYMPMSTISGGARGA